MLKTALRQFSERNKVKSTTILVKIIKWLVGIIMGFILFIGIADLLGMEFVGQTMPTGINDLAWANVTLKEVTSAPSGFLLKVQEYPTFFVINLIPQPANINELVKPGDKIAVRIKKESVEHLQDIRVISAYGLQLKDGQQIFDNTKLIPSMSNSDKGTLQKFFYKLIAIPVLYFMLLILWPIFWQKIKPQPN